MTEASQWHLDKRVPLALIGAIVMQTMAAVWWASAMQARLGALEKAIAAQASNDARLVRVEQATLMQGQSLARIEDKLDRVIERE